MRGRDGRGRRQPRQPALLVPRPARSAVVGVGTARSRRGGDGCRGRGPGRSGMRRSRLPDLLPLAGVVLDRGPAGRGVPGRRPGRSRSRSASTASGTARGTAWTGAGCRRRCRCSWRRCCWCRRPASVGTFLLCWELMALTSLLLVLAEHRRRAEVASAGALVRGDDPPGAGGHPDRPAGVRGDTPTTTRSPALRVAAATLSPDHRRDWCSC